MTTQAVGSISDLFMNDTPASTHSGNLEGPPIKKEKNTGLIVVDYLQLMRGEIGFPGKHISRSLGL